MCCCVAAGANARLGLGAAVSFYISNRRLDRNAGRQGLLSSTHDTMGHGSTRTIARQQSAPALLPGRPRRPFLRLLHRAPRPRQQRPQRLADLGPHVLHRLAAASRQEARRSLVSASAPKALMDKQGSLQTITFALTRPSNGSQLWSLGLCIEGG